MTPTGWLTAPIHWAFARMAERIDRHITAALDHDDHDLRDLPG